jgi:hypothetical protein
MLPSAKMARALGSSTARIHDLHEVGRGILDNLVTHDS